MKENSKSYRLYQGYGDNIVRKDITIPEGLEFYVNRLDRDDSSIDKDRYDLLAVVPYSKEKMDIISSNDLIAAVFENIFDKYIIWHIRDVIPIDPDFPITLTVPVIDEMYFKMTYINLEKITRLVHKLRLLKWLKDPKSESDNDIQNIIDDNTDTIYYAKIHGITENGCLDITYNYIKNVWNFEDEPLIRREFVEIRNIFNNIFNAVLQSTYLLVDKQEFDCALNGTLLSLGVMF